VGLLGLQRWENARNQWLNHSSNSSGSNHDPNNNSNTESSDDGTPRAVAVPVEVDEIIDVIFSPRWRGSDEEGPPRRFPQNVPLPQMVDVLVDLWEAEGLDT
jgi:hypothetical protein